MTRRKLDRYRSPAGKIPAHAREQERARLGEQECKAEYEQCKPIKDDLWRFPRWSGSSTPPYARRSKPGRNTGKQSGEA